MNDAYHRSLSLELSKRCSGDSQVPAVCCGCTYDAAQPSSDTQSVLPASHRRPFRPPAFTISRGFALRCAQKLWLRTCDPFSGGLREQHASSFTLSPGSSGEATAGWGPAAEPTCAGEQQQKGLFTRTRTRARSPSKSSRCVRLNIVCTADQAAHPPMFLLQALAGAAATLAHDTDAAVDALLSGEDAVSWDVPQDGEPLKYPRAHAGQPVSTAHTVARLLLRSTLLCACRWVLPLALFCPPLAQRACIQATST